MQISNSSGPFILTADIGGSHITTGICDLETYTILSDSLARTELSSKASATHILESWAGAFKQTIQNAQVTVSGLALAMPGPFDYENGISYIKGLNKYEALYGMDIKKYLVDLLRLNPDAIRFRNDAEATIAGEVLAGAGRGYQNVMGVTLGTGFGSAHYQNKITKDINLGSEPFKDTIADNILSTRWFLKRYYDLTGISVTGVKELALIADESKVAKDIFKEFAVNISDFLSAPVKQFHPEVLILCGNIAKASRLFLPYMKKQLASTSIQLAQLGEHAALIGAAGLFEPVTDKIPTL